MDVATLQTILNTLNPPDQGLTESKNSVNEELNKMKYMLGYQRGRVISEQQGVVLPTNDPLSGLPIQSRTINLNQTTTDTNTQAQPAATQQAATQPAATPKDLIRQIQTVLKTKYNANLGKFGSKGDGIDEKWGNLTQTALENALKSIADVKQRRETETQQTTTQDTAIQQAAEKGRMEVPQTNNLPNLPGIQQKQDIYTTLVNNKTLLTRNQNTVIYNGPDLSSAQRNELEQSMSQKGYRISKDNRDFRSGDKIIFKKN
jgi:ribosomal protein L13E